MTKNWALYECKHFTGNIAPGELVRAPYGTVALYTVTDEPIQAQRLIATAAKTAGAKVEQEIRYGATPRGSVCKILRVRVTRSGVPYVHKEFNELRAPCDEP